MVLKDNTRPECNLKIAFSDSLTGPYSPSSQPFTESFVEGPTVEKLGDDYLIYFDVYKKKIYGAMRTRDFKNFTDITESVSVPVGINTEPSLELQNQMLKHCWKKARRNKLKLDKLNPE